MAADWPQRTVPRELRERYCAEGHWTGATLGITVADAGARVASEPFVVHSSQRPWRGTVGAVQEIARRLAGALHARGVTAGDVVAFQLPNWMEAAAVFYAAATLGAVVVPIVHFYGPKEVAFILRESGAATFVTADRFGAVDYLERLEAVRPESVALVVVVGDGPLPPGAVAVSELAEAEPLGPPAAVDPAAPALLGYTSGTTADPKGVVHTHATLVAELRQVLTMAASAPRPALVGAPVGHAIGMQAGLLLPLLQGHGIHLTDQWDPARVLAAMLTDGLTAGSGSTFFLQSLLDHPDCTPEHRRLIGRVGMGGAPVPAAFADRVEELGISLVRSYGSTEHPSTTGSSHADSFEHRAHTDGRPLPGVEVRLDDAGQIHSRGPDLCAGYTDPRLTAEAFDADGWYATGDIGELDGDGYLTITDRIKDIVIRGGENISAAEVEQVLARHRSIAEAVVVGAPDVRFGEHACAFVRPAPAADPPTLDDLRRHCEAAGLARPKWPEELHVVEELPRTPSGKVQKFRLRDQLRAATRGAPGAPGG